MSRRRHDSPLPYSKTCDLGGDTEQLLPFIEQVIKHSEVLAGQHAIRLWEYAMAVRTISGWERELDAEITKGQAALSAAFAGHPNTTITLDRAPLQICDIGGAGSGFWQLLTDLTSETVHVVDPNIPPAGTVPATHNNDRCQLHPVSVEAFASVTRAEAIDVLTSISVIEHVDQLTPFFRACLQLLKPGGLLFLTTDCWDSEGEDVAHFHWMRKRIYNAHRLLHLLGDLRELGFKSFGEADWAYHGNQLYDYSVCSIALIKKGRA